MAEKQDGTGIKKKSVGNGMTMITSSGMDRSSYGVSNALGGKMGGSTTNLDHSIKGASANQKGN